VNISCFVCNIVYNFLCYYIMLHCDLQFATFILFASFTDFGFTFT